MISWQSNMIILKTTAIKTLSFKDIIIFQEVFILVSPLPSTPGGSQCFWLYSILWSYFMFIILWLFVPWCCWIYMYLVGGLSPARQYGDTVLACWDTANSWRPGEAYTLHCIWSSWLLPDWCQAIIWTNDDLFINPLGASHVRPSGRPSHNELKLTLMIFSN